MARTKRYNPFETRTGRFKLAAGRYHATTVGTGVKLYYRRGDKRSTWYVRRSGVNGQVVLGTADDYQDADGREVLNYFQAVKLALERVDDAKREDRPLAPRGGHTVKDAADEYLGQLQAKGKKSIPEIRRVLDKDVLPYWGTTALADVTESKLNKWIAGLVEAPRKTRGGKDREADGSDEGVRRRRATAQRKWSTLRAVLNVARKRGWVDGRAWAGIANLDNIDPPEDDFPTWAECQRLARRASDEFRPIVWATALTGAAYSELTATRVRDYTPSTGHLRIFNSKRRPRHIPLTPDGTALFDELTAGRGADELIFTHADGRPWRKSEQNRPLAEANKLAKLDPPVTLTRLRKAYGSILLNAGVPIEVVSKVMGHSSTKVTARHYSRLLQDTIDKQVRKALPKLGGRKSKVRRLELAR